MAWSGKSISRKRAIQRRMVRSISAATRPRISGRGFEFLRQAREIQPHVVRMVLSAASFRYLVKPWTEEDIVEQIGHALERAEHDRTERELADASWKMGRKVSRVKRECPEAWHNGRTSNARNSIPTMTQAQRGFTLIEVLVVIAIIAILALIAMPSYQGKVIREQIAEGVALAAVAKPPVASAWATTKALPADNAAAGLPSADKIVNNMVSAIAVADGAIHITFGNRVNTTIKGKVLTLRPAVIEDAQIVPVTWVCGHAEAPDKMTLKGLDKTDIPEAFLPVNCKAKAKK